MRHRDPGNYALINGVIERYMEEGSVLSRVESSYAWKDIANEFNISLGALDAFLEFNRAMRAMHASVWQVREGFR